MPRWRSDPFREAEIPLDIKGGTEVVLFADTFNRYFEPENLDAALMVLRAAGYRVHLPKVADGKRPLCCGRTFLSVGAVDQARQEAERTIAALEPFAARGVPIIGLEPSCMLGFRDEIPALIKGKSAKRLAEHTFRSKNSSRAKPERASSSFRSARSGSARCCMAIAIRNRSARWARSSRC